MDVTAGADSPVLKQTVSAAQPFETDATRTRDRFFTRYEDVGADAPAILSPPSSSRRLRTLCRGGFKRSSTEGEVEQQVAILLFEKHNRLTRQSGPIAALSWLNSLDREASRG